MDLKIKGKNAFITGGTRGLGLASLKSLASEGVNIAFCSRSEDGVNETTKHLSKLGVKYYGFVHEINSNDKNINTDRKINIKIPRCGSFAKVCTEFNIPDLTKNVPLMLEVNVQRARIIVHDCIFDFFSKTDVQCNKAVKQNHGISETFSTGSQNQNPPQPSS